MHDRIADPSLTGENTDTEGFVRRYRGWLIAGAAAIAAIVGLIIWLSSGEAPQTEAQVPVVSVALAGKSDISGTITGTGTIAARRPMPVGSVGEGGQVADVRVDAGDWVQQGQVLAVIDRSVQSQQIEAQAASVQVAQANANLAQANLDRALKLVDRGFISDADVDRLTAERDSAVSQVRVARAQLGELRARTARLNILAPAGGLVLERNVERGQVVSAGSGALFTLARGGEMELVAMLSETDLSRLDVGVPAQVTPVGTDQSFTGQVWQLAPTIDQSTRQGAARIALPYDRALRPGGFATARITAGSISAPVLPESAVMSDVDGSYVYIVDDKNEVVRRNVELGDVTEGGIAIASGLTGSEKVILRAGGFLSPGDKVKPSMAPSSPASSGSASSGTAQPQG